MKPQDRPEGASPVLLTPRRVLQVRGVVASGLGIAVRPLARLLGLDGRSTKIDTHDENLAGIGWAPHLALAAGVAVVLGATAANASRAGADWAVGLFYVSVGLVMFPTATRLAYRQVSPTERVALVLTATLALFTLRIIRSPVAFIDHDEFLHWLTANDIIELATLFTPNALLPVSPKFPALEIVTTAIVQLTGMSVFSSAMLLLAMCRLVFMTALFACFKAISACSRVASLACVMFMGSSTFFVFDSHFAYESLAVVFLVLALLSDVYSEAVPEKKWIVSATLTMPFLAALAVTHHMTAFFAAFLFVGLAVLEIIRLPASRFNAKAITVATFAVAAPILWSQLMGNPAGGYLGPVIRDGLYEASQLLSSLQGRELFVSEDGVVAPLWQRSAVIGSAVLICAGLLTGFLRAIAYAGVRVRLQSLLSLRSLRSWDNSRLVLLTLLTLAYPMSILFRFTRSGWEIGNRIGPFSFLGVSLVVSIGAVLFWLEKPRTAFRPVLFGTFATIILIGGIISSEGPGILVPSKFQVSADSASIEPMGIATAEWVREWIPQQSLFASDRINRLLLATYGRQQVATTLRDERDTSIAIQSEKIGPSEIRLLRQMGVDYVLADLRLTTALPVVGVYFDGGVADRAHSAPLSSKALLKFNAMNAVSRPFDNGYQVIFDVRKLDANH